MVRHPEVVEQAQAEIDRIVGGERLPTLEDRSQLPFIDCILKETLRLVYLLAEDSYLIVSADGIPLCPWVGISSSLSFMLTTITESVA